MQHDQELPSEPREHGYAVLSLVPRNNTNIRDNNDGKMGIKVYGHFRDLTVAKSLVHKMKDVGITAYIVECQSIIHFLHKMKDVDITAYITECQSKYYE